MLKFWKKKPAEAPPGQPAAATTESVPAEALAHDTDAISLDNTASALGEALAETPPPAGRSGRRRSLRAGRRLPRPCRPSAAGASAFPAARLPRGLASLFNRHPKLDDDLLDELETTLITADVGIEASTTLVEDLRKRMHKREFADATGPAGRAAARRWSACSSRWKQPLVVTGRKPFVILTVGINGVGKTTTIGKLARR